jgi:hypothetical protein
VVEKGGQNLARIIEGLDVTTPQDEELNALDSNQLAMAT